MLDAFQQHLMQSGGCGNHEVQRGAAWLEHPQGAAPVLRSSCPRTRSSCLRG